jgi:hypothetical protein
MIGVEAYPLRNYLKRPYPQLLNRITLTLVSRQLESNLSVSLEFSVLNSVSVQRPKAFPQKSYVIVQRV